MVPVAADHSANVVDGYLLPLLVSDMLPAGNLFKHEQPDFVATIEEVARLGVVGSAHDVAMKLLAQNVSILALDAGWHGLTHKRKCLMSVESAQLDDFTVQRESMICERRFAESHPPSILVNNLARLG